MYMYYVHVETFPVQGWIQDFPLWGTNPLGASTSNTDAFWQKHMQKSKNWVPLGVGLINKGGAGLAELIYGLNMSYGRA